MPTHPTKTIRDLIGIGGLETAGTRTERLVAADYTIPALIDTTVEAQLQGHINHELQYVRTELDGLPTTKFTVQFQHELWGRCAAQTWLDVATSTIDNVGDSFVTPTNPSYVIDSKAESTRINNIARFTRVLLLGSDQVSWTEDEIDEETKVISPVIHTYKIATSKPSNSALNSAGLYTVVTRVSNNIWHSVRKMATGLPVGYANRLTWNTVGNILWPDVLEFYESFPVVNAALTCWTKLLADHIREGYSGDCLVQRELWWQLTPYSVTSQVSMVPSAINIKGNLQTISIPPCLHGLYVYDEDNFTATLASTLGSMQRKLFTFAVQATNYTDWPATIVRVTQDYSEGGYRILRETFYRPDNYNASTMGITQRNWTDTDGIWYPPP